MRFAHALDLNNNGMSDVWERIYNATDPNLDPDGDGQSNFKEAQAGTNPNDPQDFFRASSPVRAVGGTSVTLSWRSVQDRYYEIEESSDLATWGYADYAYGDSGTETTTTFYLSDPSAPRLFWRARSYPEYDYDYDGDSLDTWEERLLGTDDYDGDTDNDGMDDGFEFIYQFNPLSASDGALDADGDLLTNAQEASLGLNPRLTDTDGNGVSDADEDRDLDDLTNLSEITTHQTDPAQNDTDGDGLSDGWEILYGFSALVNNETDANPANDPDADPDGDLLDNASEDQIGSNPNNSDTDGDGVNDLDEEKGGSSPTNPTSTPSNPGGTPGGPATPPPPIVPVQVTFGDPSGSHSEKYRIILEPQTGDANTKKRYRTNRKYGESQTETFNLPKGSKYKVTLVHIGTDPQYQDQPRPDYDYEIEFDTSKSCIVLEDPQTILGFNGDSDVFYAQSKSATLYVPLFEWVTPKQSPVTMPNDSGDGQNEFTYSAASPGVLTVDLKILVKPAGVAGLTGHDGVKFSDRCIYALPTISGSTFQWDTANAGGKSNTSGDNLLAKATFTTFLPATRNLARSRRNSSVTAMLIPCQKQISRCSSRKTPRTTRGKMRAQPPIGIFTGLEPRFRGMILQAGLTVSRLVAIKIMRNTTVTRPHPNILFMARLPLGMNNIMQRA